MRQSDEDVDAEREREKMMEKQKDRRRQGMRHINRGSLRNIDKKKATERQTERQRERKRPTTQWILRVGIGLALYVSGIFPSPFPASATIRLPKRNGVLTHLVLRPHGDRK